MKKHAFYSLLVSVGLATVLVAAPTQETQTKKEKTKEKEGVSITTGDAEVRVSEDGVVIKAGEAKVNIKGSPGATGSATTQEDEKLIVIRGSNQVHEYDCNGRNVKLTGGGNHVTLEGDCGEVSIEGNSNVVMMDGVASIILVGNGNGVEWMRAIGGTKPKLQQKGNGNMIRQSEGEL